MKTLPVAAVQRLAYNIKRLRKERGWSQGVLATIAGCTRNWICELENCKRRVFLSTLDLFATTFDVDARELIKPIPGKDEQ